MFFGLGDILALGQIIVIDAVMAGDNAIVVGMVAATIPVKDRRRVIMLGTLAAVVMRIGFALLAVQLLKIIGLTFSGGILLLYVAYMMYLELRGSESSDRTVGNVEGVSILRAAGMIAAADISMSLDNVLAVAGAAGGHVGVLAIGLLISVVLMAFAANALASVIERYGWVAWIGLLMVAYVACSMIVRGSIEVIGVTHAFGY